MRKRLTVIALLASLDAGLVGYAHAQRKGDMPITIRPATLADAIDELAGHAVNVPYARVVGMINECVIVIDTATGLRPRLGNRDRVVVLIQPGSLTVPRATIVGSTVRIVGVARTLLGVQVTREVTWPQELSAEVVERLEIRAAILASSVQTSEGIELTSSVSERC